jgi:hypothetical protein
MTTQTHNNSPRSDHSDVIGAASSHYAPGDTMAARLPDVVRTLRNGGVVRVVATYGGAFCGMAFLNKEADAIHPPCWPAMAREIVQVFESLVIKRSPIKGGTYHEMRGTFKWDLSRDTLTHEHTVVHHGL